MFGSSPYDTTAWDAGQFWVERLGRKWYLFCDESSQPIAEFENVVQAHKELDRRVGRRDYDA